LVLFRVQARQRDVKAKGELEAVLQFAWLPILFWVQARQRDVKAKGELEAVFDAVEVKVQKLCKDVQKQARLYQESVRSLSDLQDTVGVELFQGKSGGKNRSMVHIKQEKIDRARTYRFVALTPLAAPDSVSYTRA
jgi:hypothetical protein